MKFPRDIENNSLPINWMSTEQNLEKNLTSVPVMNKSNVGKDFLEDYLAEDKGLVDLV